MVSRAIIESGGLKRSGSSVCVGRRCIGLGRMGLSRELEETSSDDGRWGVAPRGVATKKLRCAQFDATPACIADVVMIDVDGSIPTASLKGKVQ